MSLDSLCRWQVQVSVYCAWRIPAHLRCTQCSILLHLIYICFLTCICLWQISQIQTFLFRVVPKVMTVIIDPTLHQSESSIFSYIQLSVIHVSYRMYTLYITPCITAGGNAFPNFKGRLHIWYYKLCLQIL